MAQKSKIKKPSSKRITKLHWPLFMIAVTPILLIAMTGYIVYLSVIVHDLRSSPTLFSQMIVSAINGLNRDLPLDPKTGDAYIYQAKLRIPASDETQNFAYSYIKGDQNYQQEITLAYKPFINQASYVLFQSEDVEGVLAETQKLQACSRGFKLYFVEMNDFNGTKLFEKTLTDGRIIHAYQEEKCSDNRDVLIEVLKTIDSY